ncbi:Hypothetical protein HVR_LOCUS880 [uncultured virus]|nr:Hypothetical protein HVR_LOCUS880 [uncultured virus]
MINKRILIFKINSKKLVATKMSCSLLEPPNISGAWKFTNTYYLRQEYPDQNITLNDIKYLDDFNITIKQKGLFITFKEESHRLRPTTSLNRTGVWRPIYKNRKVINWELIISDYDDSNISLAQVSKSDENGYPIKMSYVSIESGFLKGNKEQKPTVVSSVLKKNKKILSSIIYTQLNSKL